MLPKGSAQKVTVYLNEDTRSHVEPLWTTILNFLRHKQVAGATMLRAEAGFGSHEELRIAYSEYASGHRPIRIEFVDRTEKVRELLPSLYDLVTDGLITVQDITVVKSASKEHRAAAEPEPARKPVTIAAKLVRIYLGESDKYKDEPLYEAIVKKLRMMDFAGATVYRGILGYGAKRHTHRGGRFHFSHDLPVMISIVESPEKMSELVQTVSNMMQDGLIVTSDVELHKFVTEGPQGKEPAQ